MARTAKQQAALKKAQAASAAKRKSRAVDNEIARNKAGIARSRASGRSGVDDLLIGLNKAKPTKVSAADREIVRNRAGIARSRAAGRTGMDDLMAGLNSHRRKGK